MARINIFQNWPLFPNVELTNLKGVASLHIHYVDIPGSISFNNVAMIFSGGSSTAQTLSLSFGLYSLNGATLSLANSAEATTALSSNETALSWLTLATSATQDITPGHWFFAMMSSSAGTNRFSLALPQPILPNDLVNGGAGGPFFGGIFSVSTAALPASIATSDCVKEGAATLTTLNPYVIISA